MVETSHTGVPVEHAEPSALGLAAPGVVALAMVIVLIILAWKKVPSAIGKSLDKKIAAIRAQLDEAKALREEAEALKAEYEAKAKAADADAAVASIATAKAKAMSEIESVAADAVQGLVARVAGLDVDADTARAAVAKELVHG
jgi:F-type H+-transporting ATPase subunit b